jgi:dipeptidyl-peptidase-4
MRKILTSSAFLFALTVFTLTLKAQQKELSYEQIFKSAPSNIFQSLPDIQGWADDDHYLVMQKDKADSGKLKLMSVDVKSGIAQPYNKKPAPANPSFNLNNKEKNPTASPDGKWVAFTRGNNLFAKELSTGKEIQFTQDGSDNIYSGYAAWLYYEEILGRSSHYKAFWWSPDSKHIAYMHFDETQVPIFPIYNSDGLHGFLEHQHYPKAGDTNPSVKIGIVSVDNPATVWADFNEKDDQYFGMPTWTLDGSSLLVLWMPRRQNTLMIYSVNPGKGSKKIIYEEKQNTWIDLDWEDRITLLPSGQGFVLESDKSGWVHLYNHKMDGSLVNPITQGDFSVTDIVKVDENSRIVYFKARKENSARIDFYKVGLDGKGLTRLSFGEYSHEPKLSPNGKYFITTYSNIKTPPKMALVDNKGKIIRELGDSKGTAFSEYAMSMSEIVRVKSADGLFNLPMSIMYPTHFDATKKYSVVISIYGGPNAGTVYDLWSRQYLNSQWWAKEGIIQVSMDNRSSGHFGKQGMNYIFRQLGKYEIEDYMDCAKWLRAQAFVDSSKIFITGGSFGGYITCMALTYGSDYFNYGVASSSVTDWRLYDTHYTERYMERPQDNENGYSITSPQNYVKKYRGLLKVVHGNMDDNVHMQNSIQFINKLEDLDKHFEFMVYPGERHGWGGLKAIQSRNETRLFIYQNLLNKSMPEQFWK